MRSLHLLYIEDEADHRGLMSRVLSSEGWVVKAAATFEEALPVLEGGWPDLVLLDLQIGSAPAEAGFERLANLRQNYPALPVAIISVADFPHWIRRAETLGAIRFIRKPFNIETIDSDLRHLVSVA